MKLDFVYLLVIIVVGLTANQGITEEPGPRESSQLKRLSQMKKKTYFLQREGNYQEAEKLAKEWVNLETSIRGVGDPSTIVALRTLASIYRSQGKGDDAVQWYEEALKVSEENHGKDHPLTAHSMIKLASMLKSLERFEESDRLFDRALKICESEVNAENPDIATTLESLVNFKLGQEKFGGTLRLFERAFKIREEHYGVDSGTLTYSLNRLAFYYRVQGKFEESVRFYERELKIRRGIVGSEHSSVAGPLRALGYVHYKQGTYGEAERLYKEALRIEKTQSRVDRHSMATSLSLLGILHEKQGKYEEAEVLHKRAIEIRENGPRADQAGMAYALRNLGFLYQNLGRFDEARPLYERAVQIMDDRYGPDNKSTISLQNQLASLYDKLGKKDESVGLVTQMLEGSRNYFQRMLLHFTDSECLKMQQTLKPVNRTGPLLNGRLAATEQIWFKGAVLELMSQRRQAEAPLYRSVSGLALLAKRKHLSGKFSQSVFAKGKDSEMSRALKNQLEELAEKSNGQVSQESHGSIGGVSLSDVQESLGRRDVLVETFRYRHHFARGEWSDRYASAVIRGDGEPRYVAHGDAESIDKAIESYRMIMGSGNPYRTLESQIPILEEIEKKLYEQILAPIESGLTPGNTTIFSPDSQLHFLPLGMLRDDDGVPFGKKFLVRYVTTGRDLVKTIEKSSGNKSAFLVGNPSYRNNAPLIAAAKAKEEREARLVASNLRAGMSRDAERILLSPLPGTAREIERLSRRLKKAGFDAVSVSRDRATEAHVRNWVEGHDIVHLATHGFFLEKIEIKRNPHDARVAEIEEEKVSNTIQDPMYRSGLALAGAQSTFNLWGNGQVPPPSNDGILLAAEANLLNLRGTDLVVLSACETASGKALDGEGVMGLRRAFIGAGANNTIMTLWPVNDEATVEVMDAFYEKYLSDTHPAIALAEVQNELYEPFVKIYGEAEAIARLAPFVCMSVGKVE